MDSECPLPLNIGSEEMVTINALAEMAIALSNKRLTIHNIQGEEFKESTVSSALVCEVATLTMRNTKQMLDGRYRSPKGGDGGNVS